MFKTRPKSFLGIDIGNYSIRIIELEKKGNGFELKNYGESVNIPENGFGSFERNSFSLLNERVANTIKDICEQAGIETKNVNFTIPDFYTFFTSINLPLMDKTELVQAIEYEVRPYIPLPISEITLDWNIIEGIVGKTPLNVLVAAVPNDVVAQYKEIAKLSDLNPNFLEPEVFSLARTLKKESEESVLGLVDIGIKSTTCTIIDKGLLKTSHSFNIGGSEITEALARSLNLKYNEAEEIKKEKGITESPSKDIILPLIDSIIEENKKVFRNYYAEKGQEIKKIILAGGSMEMPGLQEYLKDKLKKEISIINPFVNITFPDVLKQELKKRGPFYAIALGAALKGFE
ncbi:MAG: type IV pilus assembly protein PilM [Candidatus Pacebacteria bacterium]|nr:type IV pilus assembly protein PilM [Candidatus Paceibacterota bacterium]